MTRLRVGCALALLLLGCGHTNSAQHAAELPPADPVAVRAFVAGVRLMRSGNRARSRSARARFERALSIDPNLWEAHYNLGVLDRRAGELTRAIAHFQAARAIQPAAVEPLRALAESKAASGEVGGAVDLLEDLVRAHPDDADARVSLAALNRRQGRYRPALEQAREVLIRDPQNRRALLEVGRVYRARERLDVAELVFQKAFALTDESDGAERAEIRNEQGLVDLARGDTQAAFQRFDEALTLDSSFSPAHINEASVLLAAGDYEGAKGHYEALLSGDSANVDARIGLAICLRGLGHPRQALREYNRVLEAHPGNVDAIFDLGVLEAEFLDRRPRARERFVRFLELAPSDHPMREVAERYLQEIPAPAPRPRHRRRSR
ncbi:MAG: tetratricopeptide repeat protein [Deltaproteobacteria bacterium]|nr:tetratricopeptide repeat protein [Deltaproteobacteria bacterium]